MFIMSIAVRLSGCSMHGTLPFSTGPEARWLKGLKMRVLSLTLIILPVLALCLSCGGESSDGETASGTETVAPEPSADEQGEAEISSAPSEDPSPGTEPVAEDAQQVISGPSGTWDTTMGELEISSDDSGDVTGRYPLGSLNGSLDGTTLEFTYTEGSLAGTGSFTFDEGFTTFTGVQDVAGTELVWEGRRI